MVISTTLSCIYKCIRFFVTMINKKIVIGLFLISSLGACTSPTALVGPAYTLSSSGNKIQIWDVVGGGTPIWRANNTALNANTWYR